MEELDRWCRSHLREGIGGVLFRLGYLSTVVGVRLLSSGRSVVIKVRRPSERLQACWAVQGRLFDRGFACPEPLVGPEPLGDLVASAEALVSGGDLFPRSGRAPAPFARALATLIGVAPDLEELPSLDPPLPWAGPDRRSRRLWPWPDDRNVDLNAVDGPAWLDEAGAAARSRLERNVLPKVAGHGDWYTGNLRWSGSDLHVAFDWDSVIAASEAEIVGLAAAVYPATEAGTEATVEETEEFLVAYATASGHPFSESELEVAWAAGLWNRSFDAKKQVATDGAEKSLIRSEALERRNRSGIL